MKLIPNKLTKLSALEVLRAFRDAFVVATGSPPSNSTLSILVAQSALECGHWLSMHCYNFGNMRPPRNWQGDYCQFRCNEKINGAWVWFDPPSPGSNFLAFESATDGALYYMQALLQKWPEAWSGALQGNAQTFVHGLKQRGYFTADETPYRVAVQRLCTEFLGYLIKGLLDPEAQVSRTTIPPDAMDAVSTHVLIAPALLVGARGEAVAAWQAAIGMTGVQITGDFDAETESATMRWQRVKNLSVTGWVSEADLEAAGLMHTHPDTIPSPAPAG